MLSQLSCHFWDTVYFQTDPKLASGGLQGNSKTCAYFILLNLNILVNYGKLIAQSNQSQVVDVGTVGSLRKQKESTGWWFQSL